MDWPRVPEAMSIPSWFSELLGVGIPGDGEKCLANGTALIRDGEILRAESAVSSSQAQTRETFGFKWKKRDTYEGHLAANMRHWLIEKYGNVAEAPWLAEHGEHPILLDAGCGAGFSVLELFGPLLPRLRFIGVDISGAIDVARERFQERGFEGVFLQVDCQQLPLPKDSVDLIFSEGVLHHCDDTRAAFEAIVSHLKPGGRILFYVYKKKGPIREFTDDYIRQRLQDCSPEEAWKALLPLTKLGEALGKLNLEIEVPEDIALLDIPAGTIDLQRFFYWHIFKAFYGEELSLEEMNHINFDWYTPQNAHRQTPEEVRDWCAALNLSIEHERVENAGITIIARKAAS